MSTSAINAVLWLKLSPTQKSVINVLALYADENGVCSLSVPTLSKATSLCETSISRALTQLHESGYIVRQFRPCAPSVFSVQVEFAAKQSARRRPKSNY
ncbi:MAG: helix-turn-helix domain-containing protein [bacterium]|jgi:hypothetical protein|nr:helix-turn-helix domain-containing protein [Betaproteobacteria bacterium]